MTANQAVALMEDGRTQRYFTRLHKVSHYTIQIRFGVTGRSTRRLGSDRKRAANALDNRFIVINSLSCLSGKTGRTHSVL